ncbi:diguanylate cyclase (GGDEF) domain-containing protein [Cohnella sp. OV330]|uniref:GGDEF domain-containing protein n=1 Tax=Cohnella sp. OV330 TaxID=1855288 RepID=UPI0008EB069C|nr:GGDEF domain-containing protein [Cohnella sp. OV330]SFB41270.1 diguanylate cyclase (GGDEF) domain-containing protein [Cohnella sp. OV330]
MDVQDFWNNRELLLASSSAASAVIIGLMMFMAYRLIAGNRSSAFRLLLLALSLLAVYHGLSLADALGALEGRTVPQLSGVLYIAAFIALNFAFFELYYRKRARTRAWFYGLLAVGVTIAVCNLLSATGVPAAEIGAVGTGERANLLLALEDGYVLVLSGLFAMMFAPHLRQRARYAVSLCFAFFGQLAAFLTRDFGVVSPVFDLMAAILPVFYYIVLFMILFERVVELMQTAYRSSITDGLTDLYNRRFFNARLEKSLEQAGQGAVGAIFCDIDDFKKLNDTKGHQAADIVLKQAAAILRDETEGIGLAGRYGGEELVAFVHSASLDAPAVAERIRARIAKETIVTVSVGCALSMPGVKAEQLMKNADEAMYRSKRSGKNRVTLYDQP